MVVTAFDPVDCRTNGDNDCHAEAQGGDVSLTSVDIHFKPGDTMQVNGGSVDAATVAGGDAEAAAVCINENGEWSAASGSASAARRHVAAP